MAQAPFRRLEGRRLGRDRGEPDPSAGTSRQAVAEPQAVDRRRLPARLGGHRARRKRRGEHRRGDRRHRGIGHAQLRTRGRIAQKKAARRNEHRAAELRYRREPDYIIPLMSGMPPPAPPPSFSGISATIASVVRMFFPIEAAFCSAERVTMAGSMMPAATRSSISPVSALRPLPFLALRTSFTTTEPSSPAL